MAFDDRRFFQLIMELEKYLQMTVSEDRTKCIHLVYKNISRMLNSYQGQLSLENSPTGTLPDASCRTPDGRTTTGGLCPALQ